MDIVVEDGSGIVTANAYATALEVDDILSVNIHSTWPDIAATEIEENLIIWASRILDERVTWKGKKTFETSGMAWPRTGVYDREGILVDDDIVPDAVKIATAILADHLLAGNPEAANSASNMTQLQVDVIMLKFDAHLATERYPVELSFILKGLGYFAGRGGYKRIIKH